MYIWTKQYNYSRTALSDCTDHKAPALMTSIQPILNDLVDKGIKKINVVSDSPTSQYQNRRMVWILHCCCKEKMIDLKWIYLESGHRKGIPDGIGATVKKAIKDLPLFHPDDPLCNVGDLFSHNIQDCIPSIELNVYSKEDVQKFNSFQPKVGEIKGILKVHEVFY